MSTPHINRYQLSRRCEVHDDTLKDIFDVITACMEEGVEVRIRDFGTFVPKIRAARIMKSTLVEGGEKKLGTRRVITFRMSKALRKQWTKKVPEDVVGDEATAT